MNITVPKVIDLRHCTLDDCQSVFEWRNHEEVRKFFFDARKLSWDTHLAWFSAQLESDSSILLIGEVDREPVGVLRFDLADYDARTSIYLVPDKMKKGLGSVLLRSGVDWIRSNRPVTKLLVAKIIPENTASVHCFEKAGFEMSMISGGSFIRAIFEMEPIT